jgi:asparagine synthase (glutamine-hydrolysing)
MCGIQGFFYFDESRPAEPELARRMREAARHRGPDDHGDHIDRNLALAFNRLSIIDLSGGHQPMSNEDGTVWIIFNGEIYNFAGLREDLIARGHRFQTHSDTETIVHAWEEFGERCVEKLRGMFAFAIWDSRTRTLFIARDRLGIKPLYFYRDREIFAFASEMKSLFELPGLPRRVDPGALTEFLLHRYVIGPQTILKDVKKLLPGHTLTVTAQGVRTRRYWDLPLDEPRHVSTARALEEFDHLLTETVRQHLVADVPLGAFLSGGLDSSAVIAMMHKLKVPAIKTFSVGYDSPESELPYARIVASHFHTEHHELILKPEHFQGELPRIVWQMDEPVADEAALPLYFVAKLARENVTVALSGEGSDEILCGYPIYRMMGVLSRLNSLPFMSLAGQLFRQFAPPGRGRKYGIMLGQPLEKRYGGVATSFPKELLATLLLPGTDGAGYPDAVAEAYQVCAGMPPLHRMSYVDIKTWLPSNLLVKADRMSMAVSLELRVPFLDHELVEFAYRLPAAAKLHRNNGKWLLKRYMEPMLPREIIYRPKKGFAVPTRTWFRNDLAGFARETLLGSGGASDDFFSKPVIEQVLAAPESRDQSGQIYSLLVFDQWYRRFVKSAAPMPA